MKVSSIISYIVEDLLDTWSHVSVRRMFDGYGIFRDGIMFALVHDEVVYLKTNEETALRYASFGSKPFTYERNGKPVSLSYWELPEGALDDREQFLDFAEEAYDVALR